jgi:hypothetical protein
MRELLWLVALIGAGIGGLTTCGTLATANGAPQQAAGFALGLALACVPYVLARSWEELVGKPAPGEKREKRGLSGSPRVVER